MPLIDDHAEILNRRPEDWDDATGDFGALVRYNGLTLLAQDRIGEAAAK